nr:hypothetical protein [Flavobacteriales bacterium]
LFVQINDNQFEFAHKSIQEYLAGKYISSYQPILDLRKSLEKLPIEVAIGTGWAVNRNYFFKCARQIFSNPIELELMNVNGSPGLDDDALERVNERLNNYISYIKRLTVEKANFEATTDMGFEILTIWQEVFEFRPDLRNDFWEFFQLRGVRSSFNLLEEFYSINPIEYVRLKKMSAVAISDEKLEFSVDIQLRGGQSRKDKNLPYLRLPLFFVLEWKYVRSYL